MNLHQALQSLGTASSELTSHEVVTGCNVTFERRAGNSGPILKGEFGTSEGLSGMQLQCCHHLEMEDGRARTTLPPGLVLVYLLKGSVEFSLNKTVFHLNAADSPQGFAFNLTRPTAFTRRLVAGNQVRKLVISIAHATAKQILRQESFAGMADSVLEQHLFRHHWHGTPAQVMTCDQIIEKSATGATTIPLAQEANTLALTQLSLETLQQQLEPDLPITPIRQDNTAAGIANHIDAMVMQEHGPSCHLDNIAAQLNMSTSKLQRLFKQHSGRTVMEYIRGRRLLKAQEAMLQRGISIGEAAFLAGYNHSSNFCLAFKKQFGYSPGQLTR